MDKKRFGKPTAVETITEDRTREDKPVTIQVNKGHVENSVKEILEYIGEDSEREGLLKTPNRVARMLDELTTGYHTNPEKLINGAIFSADYDEMVVVNDIEFYSLCEHHLLPFFGKAHVAYIPKDKVIGLSKIPRIVDMYARRLQIQEQMTSQIAEFLGEAIDAKGVAVVIEGSHMCSMMRGVKKQSSKMRTMFMTGDFKKDKDLRREFLNQIPAP
jgi:GTP cyclohydrolase I